MEALILAVIITYAIKKAAESSHEHWHGSKAANRRNTRGQRARQRAASAARHDAAYWAHQVRGGFPLVRHGLYMGWNAGRVAQLEGRVERAKAKTGRLEKRAGAVQAVREQRRRQAEILEEIRLAEILEEIRAGAAPGPEPQPAAEEGPGDAQDPGTSYSWGPASSRLHWPAAGREHAEARARQMSTDGEPRAVCEYPPGGGPGKTVATYVNGALVQPPAPSTEGSPMSGDTTYTQQMRELEAIRRDAEEEVSDVRRKRMASRLDVLMSLGLDAATLSEAAAIDDALQAQEKAAQQTLDATDAAISGLAKRHGGIKAAVDDAPVDKPAEPAFYQD